MNKEYELTRQDYINFNIFHLYHSKTNKRSLMIQRFVLPIIFLIAPLFEARYSNISLWYWYIIFSIVTILWIVLYPQFINRVISKKITKMLSEGKNKGLLGIHTVSINEDGIVDQTEYGAISSKTLEQVMENEDYLFLYNSAISAYIIPKRIFESVDEMQEFINILYRIVNKKDR